MNDEPNYLTWAEVLELIGRDGAIPMVQVVLTNRSYFWVPFSPEDILNRDDWADDNEVVAVWKSNDTVEGLVVRFSESL